MGKLETENKTVVCEYYEYTLKDLKENTSVEEMMHVLKCFEEEENYLACAGIISAVEDYQELTKTIK